MNNNYTDPSFTELYRDVQKPLVSNGKNDSISFWLGLAIGASVAILAVIFAYERKLNQRDINNFYFSDPKFPGTIN